MFFFKHFGTSRLFLPHLRLEAWKPKDDDVLKPTSLEAAEQIVSQVWSSGFIDGQMRVSSQKQDLSLEFVFG